MEKQYKIKLEDKAALLNRMEKAGVGLGSEQITNNKLEGYFEVTVTDPRQIEALKVVVKQSPKIDFIKEQLTKAKLREMILQELYKK
jgi:3'-phosphoadenosine 5'-phosphosulfate sulfotransferase